MTHPPTDPALQDCIDACRQCHDTCLQTALVHCLKVGGRHVEADHFRLMLNCSEICQTAANFMLSGSPLHSAVCAVCAEVCVACAESCQEIGDMDDCARICRDCAQSCGAMGKPSHLAAQAQAMPV